jgi:hypothetical protein
VSDSSHPTCQPTPFQWAAAAPFVHNGAALALAVPSRDCRQTVNWPVAGPLDRGITCVGLRQPCAAQAEFSIGGC